VQRSGFDHGCLDITLKISDEKYLKSSILTAAQESTCPRYSKQFFSCLWSKVKDTADLPGTLIFQLTCRILHKIFL